MRLWTAALILAGLLSFAPTALAQTTGPSVGAQGSASTACTCCPRGNAKIADIASIQGTVVVIRGDGTRVPVQKVGRRLRGSSIFCGDTVDVIAGSATIVLPNDTRVTVNAGLNSRFALGCRAVPKPTPQGPTIGRRIREAVGGFVVDIVGIRRKGPPPPVPACGGVRG